MQNRRLRLGLQVARHETGVAASAEWPPLEAPMEGPASETV